MPPFEKLQSNIWKLPW